MHRDLPTASWDMWAIDRHRGLPVVMKDNAVGWGGSHPETHTLIPHPCTIPHRQILDTYRPFCCHSISGRRGHPETCQSPAPLQQKPHGIQVFGGQMEEEERWNWRHKGGEEQPAPPPEAMVKSQYLQKLRVMSGSIPMQ